MPARDEAQHDAMQVVVGEWFNLVIIGCMHTC